MSRPRLEIADIFRDHGPAWRQDNAGHVSLSQLKVMSAIEACRSFLREGFCTGERDRARAMTGRGARCQDFLYGGLSFLAGPGVIARIDLISKGDPE